MASGVPGSWLVVEVETETPTPQVDEAAPKGGGVGHMAAEGCAGGPAIPIGLSVHQFDPQ